LLANKTTQWSKDRFKNLRILQSIKKISRFMEPEDSAPRSKSSPLVSAPNESISRRPFSVNISTFNQIIVLSRTLA